MGREEEAERDPQDGNCNGGKGGLVHGVSPFRMSVGVVLEQAAITALKLQVLFLLHSWKVKPMCINVSV
jgi:hypothetical protein